MKYKLTVNSKTYEVEIENINARPVVATVDGQRFEIMAEHGDQPQVQKEAGTSSVPGPAPAASLQSAPTIPAGGNSLTAPLPGTVVELFVKAGDNVETGQVVLVIEAMKMKNSIRSTRGGTIAKVLVSQGQSVSHKQALVEFGE